MLCILRAPVMLARDITHFCLLHIQYWFWAFVFFSSLLCKFIRRFGERMGDTYRHTLAYTSSGTQYTCVLYNQSYWSYESLKYDYRWRVCMFLFLFIFFLLSSFVLFDMFCCNSYYVNVFNYRMIEWCKLIEMASGNTGVSFFLFDYFLWKFI